MQTNASRAEPGAHDLQVRSSNRACYKHLALSHTIHLCILSKSPFTILLMGLTTCHDRYAVSIAGMQDAAAATDNLYGLLADRGYFADQAGIALLVPPLRQTWNRKRKLSVAARRLPDIMRAICCYSP
jgi:hypothetical protein